MQRREFVALFSGAAAWPLAARAQDAGGVRRIAVLTTFSDKDVLAQGWLAAFRKGLDEFNWRDGRNVRIDYRWAADDADRLRGFAQELVALQPDVIFAVTTPAVAALVRETRTLPIVFAQVSDPVGAALSPRSRGQAATSRGSRTSTSNRRSAANGWSLSSRSRPRPGMSP